MEGPLGFEEWTPRGAGQSPWEVRAMQEALTQRLAPLTAGGGYYQSPQERVLIEPVLAAAINDKMDGSFSREEFNGAREYETGREWLQCAAPPRPRSSPPGPPPLPNQSPRIP